MFSARAKYRPELYRYRNARMRSRSSSQNGIDSKRL